MSSELKYTTSLVREMIKAKFVKVRYELQGKIIIFCFFDNERKCILHFIVVGW